MRTRSCPIFAQRSAVWPCTRPCCDAPCDHLGGAHGLPGLIDHAAIILRRGTAAAHGVPPPRGRDRFHRCHATTRVFQRRRRWAFARVLWTVGRVLLAAFAKVGPTTTRRSTSQHAALFSSFRLSPSSSHSATSFSLCRRAFAVPQTSRSLVAQLRRASQRLRALLSRSFAELLSDLSLSCRAASLSLSLSISHRASLSPVSLRSLSLSLSALSLFSLR